MQIPSGAGANAQIKVLLFPKFGGFTGNIRKNQGRIIMFIFRPPKRLLKFS